jgi:hypothetical protein
MANKAKKTSAERKRYSIDFDEWLEDGETLVTVTYAITPDTASGLDTSDEAIAINGRSCEFYAEDGDDGVTYNVVATATTSAEQVKEVEITFFVRDLD